MFDHWQLSGPTPHFPCLCRTQRSGRKSGMLPPLAQTTQMCDSTYSTDPVSFRYYEIILVLVLCGCLIKAGISPAFNISLDIKTDGDTHTQRLWRDFLPIQCDFLGWPCQASTLFWDGRTNWGTSLLGFVVVRDKSPGEFPAAHRVPPPQAPPQAPCFLGLSPSWLAKCWGSMWRERWKWLPIAVPSSRAVLCQNT